ncbi:retrovirus-related Pol polyprotein from transposon 17.6 [Nephila pilipes]|uniref:Retrovirus-related Pol polyprotein from transposon 17.6 n=1 Tax=Nephila pilipes TaxID=299642 RepID=A0A8X6PGL6_NEPPI|nr:retrovirus-related Pol polyprotein from transposon 17.6 [Nephila pilipes]
MKVGLQKKSQLLENQNKIWVKSASSIAEHENIVSSRNQQFSRKPFPRINNRGYATKQQEDRPPVKCYGCGTSGFTRAKCPNCTAEPKTESSRFEFLEASSCFVTTASVSTVYLRINGIFGKACADTGSSHSIAGETLYTLLKDEGAMFRNGTMCISLADGQRSTEDVLITTVTLEIEGRKFDQELIALPNAKRNRTLLGIDFLKKSGIMLDLRNQLWFFADMPQKQFAFGEHANDQHPVDNLDVKSVKKTGINMGSSGLRLPFLVCFIFLWISCKAYEGGICDEPQTSIYCTCDTRYRETSINCFVTSNMSTYDEVWRSISDVENVITLKLHSMLPMRLNFIPIDSLRHMKTLKSLSIQQGNLGVLEAYAVTDLKELRELVLDGSEITSLEANSIANLPKLKKLSLSENLLQEVLAESLSGLEDLEHLFLDRNNISRVEGCAFCDLQSLKELELWGNQITDLTEYMFRGLRYLKRLDLYKNQIRILNDKIFHSMPKLVEIDLKDNLISHIAPNAFQGLEKLQMLMLNSNKIKMLPDQVFKPLPNLRSVDMYNNELETLQVEVVENMANVKEEHFSFSFKENPINCDCTLQWVKSYLELTKSHQFSRELRDLQCKPDGENQTLQTVHLLKLDCDKSTITKQKSMMTSSRSVTQPANLVPYEIHGRKNQTKKMTIVTDAPDLQDSEPVEELAEEIESRNGEDNGALILASDWRLSVFVTLWTLFLVRIRKGTLL